MLFQRRCASRPNYGTRSGMLSNFFLFDFPLLNITKFCLILHFYVLFSCSFRNSYSETISTIIRTTDRCHWYLSEVYLDLVQHWCGLCLMHIQMLGWSFVSCFKFILPRIIILNLVMLRISRSSFITILYSEIKKNI